MVFDDQPTRKPTERLVDELIDLIEAAVARRWRAANSPVVPLSGGFDSRYLVAEILRQTGDPDMVQTITWGEDASRPGGDAVIAARVAAQLGVPNKWYEKQQRLTAATFRRAIYLSSGEADCAIHYPEDHLLHAELARQGYVSLFRGDQQLGQTKRLLTKRAVRPAVNQVYLALDAGYTSLLDAELLRRLADEEADDVDAFQAALGSRTPTGRLHESKYSSDFRRGLAPYNMEKHAELEV